MNNEIIKLLGNCWMEVEKDVNFISADINGEYVTVEHYFGLRKNDEWEDIVAGATVVDEMCTDRDAGIYETQLLFN